MDKKNIETGLRIILILLCTAISIFHLICAVIKNDYEYYVLAIGWLIIGGLQFASLMVKNIK